MALYEIQHAVPLTIAQQDELADEITSRHYELFGMPTMFVHVRFHYEHPSSSPHSTPHYVGGKRRTINQIRAYIRSAPLVDSSEWHAFCHDMQSLWESVVPMPKTRRADPDPDFSLPSILILGAVTAGREQDLAYSTTGLDHAWMLKNWDEIQQRKEQGDANMQSIHDDVKMSLEVYARVKSEIRQEEMDIKLEDAS